MAAWSQPRPQLDFDKCDQEQPRSGRRAPNALFVDFDYRIYGDCIAVEGRQPPHTRSSCCARACSASEDATQDGDAAPACADCAIQVAALCVLSADRHSRWPQLLLLSAALATVRRRTTGSARVSGRKCPSASSLQPLLSLSGELKERVCRELGIPLGAAQRSCDRQRGVHVACLSGNRRADRSAAV